MKTNPLRFVCACVGSALPLAGLANPPLATAVLPRETDQIAFVPGTPAHGANRFALNGRTNRIYPVAAGAKAPTAPGDAPAATGQFVWE